MLIYHNFLQSSPFVPASSSHLVSFLAECCTVTGQPTYLLASDENESPCDVAEKGKEDYGQGKIVVNECNQNTQKYVT